MLNKLKDIVIIISLFILGFTGAVYTLELAAYLLTLPNTVANISGYCVYVITLSTIIFTGYTFIRSLIK
jgi:hypothetical protein